MKSALSKKKLLALFRELTPQVIYSIYFSVNVILCLWPGRLTKDLLDKIKRTIPEAEHVFDFSIIDTRVVPGTYEFMSGNNHRSSKEILPELVKLADYAYGYILSADWDGQTKADASLRAIATKPGLEEDYEACIYLASRGDKNCCDIEKITNEWKLWIFEELKQNEFQGPYHKNVPKTIKTKIKNGSLTLAEAASIMTFNNRVKRFWTPRDFEDDIIDTTMLRMVEWFEIGEFDAWWKSLALNVQDDIKDIGADAQWLFNWCRSDLAMRITGKDCLETCLWMLNSTVSIAHPQNLFHGNHKKTHKSATIFGLSVSWCLHGKG